MKSAKNYIVAGIVVAVFAFYIVWNSGSSTSVGNQSAQVSNTNPVAEKGSSGAGGTNGSGAGTGSGSSGSTGSTGQYKNGTYTGDAADAIYGTVQVAAVIKNGKLTDVQFVRYPSGNGHTDEMSSMSLPQLKQEAIQSQSANVNIVSGATQTSQAFQQSLFSALSQAQA